MWNYSKVLQCSGEYVLDLDSVGDPRWRCIFKPQIQNILYLNINFAFKFWIKDGNPNIVSGIFIIILWDGLLVWTCTIWLVFFVHFAFTSVRDWSNWLGLYYCVCFIIVHFQPDLTENCILWSILFVRIRKVWIVQKWAINRKREFWNPAANITAWKQIILKCKNESVWFHTILAKISHIVK